MPRWFDVLARIATLTVVGLWACGPDAPDAATRDGPAGSPAAPAEAPAPPAATGASEGPGPRVVFLGTSLTAGLGLRRPDQRWPERLDALADSAEAPIRILNAGRSGDTSAGGLARLDWVLQDTVDVLVLELGANDGLRGQSTEALADNLRAIVDRTREAWPEARVLLVGMEAPTNLGAAYTERFRAVFRSVAEERDVPLVPFLLEGVAGVPELNQSDRIHPTAEGHARIARTVWPWLEPLVRDAAAERAP
ncbi:MAG: arylesterase [Longimicrobiales bacterium]